MGRDEKKAIRREKRKKKRERINIIKSEKCGLGP